MSLSLLYSPSTYAALAVVLALLYALYRAALPKPFPGIPYHKDSARNVLGDIPSLIRFRAGNGQGPQSISDWFTYHFRELNAPVFQLFLDPLGKPTICITDPRESQDILLRRVKEFDRSPFFEKAFSGTIPNHHIVQQTNDKFRAGRRLVADTMTTPFLNTVAAPHIHKHSKYLMELWRVKNRLSGGHAFAVAKDINHMALDSIWEVAYGSEIQTVSREIDFLKATAHVDMPADKDDAITLPNPEDSPVVKSMHVVTSALDSAITSPFPSLTHWFLRQTPSFRHAKAYQTKLVQERLNDAKKRLLTHGVDTTGGDEFHAITCATDHMVRREAQMAAKEGRAPVYDSPAAIDELFGFLIAGHETTATTMMWILRFLSDYPHVQAKLRAALYAAHPAAAAANQLPTAEAMVARSVPYLDAVNEEILRCGMTTMGSHRCTTREVDLLGHTLPAGVQVWLLSVGPGYVQPNAVNETIPEAARSATSRERKGRVPAWDDADVGAFRPERWLRRRRDERDEQGERDGQGGDGGGEVVFDANAGPVLQFGAGLRGCFGRKMAYMELRMLVTMAVWTFEFLPVPAALGGMHAYDTLTHKPTNCYVRLRETGKGN